MKAFLIYASIVLFIGTAVNSCETFSGRSLAPIESLADATIIIESIGSGIFNSKLLEELKGEVFTDTVINGLSGTAIVSGNRIIENDVICGDDCIQNSTITEIIVEFNSYRVSVGSGRESTISGTVLYFESDIITIDQDFYINSRFLRIEGEEVDIKLVSEDESGTEDRISFRVTGDSPRLLTGWCRPENGIKYRF